MKRTLILTAEVVTVAVGLTAGAQARALTPAEERLANCLLLELAEARACAEHDSSLVAGYVDIPSATPRKVLGGKIRPVAESQAQ